MELPAAALFVTPKRLGCGESGMPLVSSFGIHSKGRSSHELGLGLWKKGGRDVTWGTENDKKKIRRIPHLCSATNRKNI